MHSIFYLLVDCVIDTILDFFLKLKEKHQLHCGQMHVHCVSQNSFNIIHFNSTSKPEKTLKFPPIHSEILEHTINGTVVGIDGIPFDFHNHCSLKRLTLNLIYEEVAAHLQFVVIVIISIFAFSNLSLNIATTFVEHFSISVTQVFTIYM